MRFADFMKQTFPLKHPSPLIPKVKIRKRRQTISGFNVGDRVSFHWSLDRQGTVTRCAGHLVYVKWDTTRRLTATGHHFSGLQMVPGSLEHRTSSAA